MNRSMNIDIVNSIIQNGNFMPNITKIKNVEVTKLYIKFYI